jgi:membrane fusion protein (multidrug efflux system)
MLVSAGLCMALCSCGSKDAQTVRGPSQQFVAEGYVVTRQPFENILRVKAGLLPSESVEIKSPVAGTVLAIHFREGEAVTQGQSLVQIDDRVWKAQIKGYEAQLQAAREVLKRREDLLAVEGVSYEEVEAARSQVRQLEAHIEELAVSVSLASVQAPFSGRVGMRDFSVGAYLAQGQIITQLAQINPIKVDFNFPGQYINQICSGLRVKVVANNDTLTAPIYAVSPTIDESERTLQARALLTNTKGWLPGDFAEVNIVIDHHDAAIVAPTQYVIPDMSQETVFTVKNGKAVKTNITTGARNNEVVMINSGLQEGDTILATGLLQIRPGMAVKITKVN